MKFTKSQLDVAIRHGDTNLQLIACAGSGKTEVVAQRVANLLKAGLKPGNIIAFTFTDKAAAELKDRIVTRCREAMGDVYEVQSSVLPQSAEITESACGFHRTFIVGITTVRMGKPGSRRRFWRFLFFLSPTRLEAGLRGLSYVELVPNALSLNQLQ